MAGGRSSRSFLAPQLLNSINPKIGDDLPGADGEIKALGLCYHGRIGLREKEATHLVVTVSFPDRRFAKTFCVHC
jgi:hypothetical protein